MTHTLDSPKPAWWWMLCDWGDRYKAREKAMKDALRSIREECTSGYPEMAAVDEQWRNLFGDTADAPWKACLCWQGGRCPIHGANA